MNCVILWSIIFPVPWVLVLARSPFESSSFFNFNFNMAWHIGTSKKEASLPLVYGIQLLFTATRDYTGKRCTVRLQLCHRVPHLFFFLRRYQVPRYQVEKRRVVSFEEFEFIYRENISIYLMTMQCLHLTDTHFHGTKLNDMYFGS